MADQSAHSGQSGRKSLSKPSAYDDDRERSPALKLLKMSLHGMAITGPCGRVEVTMSDVAASLAMPSPAEYTYYGGSEITISHEKLSLAAYRYARLKYLDDEALIDQVVVTLWGASGALAIENGWKLTRGKPFLRNASIIALGKELGAKRLTQCNKCNGAGFHRKGQCNFCHGTGKSKENFSELGRLLGTDEKNAKAVWEPRIQKIMGILREWDRQVISHLYYQFSQD